MRISKFFCVVTTLCGFLSPALAGKCLDDKTVYSWGNRTLTIPYQSDSLAMVCQPARYLEGTEAYLCKGDDSGVWVWAVKRNLHVFNPRNGDSVSREAVELILESRIGTGQGKPFYCF